MIVAPACKKISLKRLMACTTTLRFPWSGVDSLGLSDLQDEVVSAVEKWQLLQRCREEAEILFTERDNIILSVREMAKKTEVEARSWLTTSLVFACTDLVDSHGCSDHFFAECETASDHEGDSDTESKHEDDSITEI